MDDAQSKSSLSLRERARVRGSKKLQTRARELRQNASEAENLLWRHLRARHLHGYKFRRQVVIEPYIVDFICFEKKLIIEADGGQHSDQVEYDGQRTAHLRSMGYRVLRFWNHEILKETEAVLEQIALDLFNNPSP